MAEQTERSAQHPNRSPEHLTFGEAAARLHLSPDAVRMRARRGKLATIRVNDRPFILWPQPEPANAPRPELVRSAVPGDPRLVAALEARIASLERQLATRDEEIRRRDHIIAGLIERVPALPASTTQDAARSGKNSSTSDVPPEEESQPFEPVSATLALAWRRWWRQVRGDG